MMDEAPAPPPTEALDGSPNVFIACGASQPLGPASRQPRAYMGFSATGGLEAALELSSILHDMTDCPEEDVRAAQISLLQHAKGEAGGVLKSEDIPPPNRKRKWGAFRVWRDDRGKRFYYNTVTKESQYEPPEEVYPPAGGWEELAGMAGDYVRQMNSMTDERAKALEKVLRERLPKGDHGLASSLKSPSKLYWQYKQDFGTLGYFKGVFPLPYSVKEEQIKKVTGPRKGKPRRIVRTRYTCSWRTLKNWVEFWPSLNMTFADDHLNPGIQHLVCPCAFVAKQFDASDPRYKHLEDTGKQPATLDGTSVDISLCLILDYYGEPVGRNELVEYYLILKACREDEKDARKYNVLEGLNFFGHAGWVPAECINENGMIYPYAHYVDHIDQSNDQYIASPLRLSVRTIRVIKENGLLASDCSPPMPANPTAVAQEVQSAE
eukprot:m.341575 g.341575  ORF g.341575 m.341575 type:complete len:436 (+) comp20211_c0_seq1:186-1493(+)